MFSCPIDFEKRFGKMLSAGRMFYTLSDGTEMLKGMLVWLSYSKEIRFLAKLCENPAFDAMKAPQPSD